MATLSSLCGPSGPLTEIRLPLERHEQQRRWLYGTASFMDWFAYELPRLDAGRLQADTTPDIQLWERFLAWSRGDPMRYGTMFKDLSPRGDEVWEMKTPDIRVFGWMCAPRHFIAVFGDYADNYKPPTKTPKYDDAKRLVIMARSALALDEPKVATGNYDALVLV